jgi:signal transduction histidine kinase
MFNADIVLSALKAILLFGIAMTEYKSSEVASKIEEIQKTVQQLHREIRTTSYLLHPPLLDESGLYSAIS